MPSAAIKRYPWAGGTAQILPFAGTFPGVPAAYVNPLGINRTVLMNDTGFTTTSRSHRDKLRQVITSSVTGDPSDRLFGPEREQGYIGRTMKSKSFEIVQSGSDHARNDLTCPGVDLPSEIEADHQRVVVRRAVWPVVHSPCVPEQLHFVRICVPLGGSTQAPGKSFAQQNVVQTTRLAGEHVGICLLNTEGFECVDPAARPKQADRVFHGMRVEVTEENRQIRA